MSTVVSNNRPLAYESVKEVPKTHAWSFTNDYPISSDPLPIINPNDPNVLNQLSEACKTVGAFQLVGHGVSLDFLESFEHQMVRLFSLPMEQKLKAARTETNMNGYGVVPISKFFTSSMWSEGITFIGSPLEHAQKLWPDDPTQFCNVMEDYDKEMKSLACKIMKLLLNSLGLNDDDIDSDNMIIAKPNELNGTVRFNHYPECPEPERAIGMAGHTDSSFITILYQSNATGLQALLPSDGSNPTRWATFPAINGGLIVILGDLFQILTNGVFRSGYHPVVVNRSHARLTSAYFCMPVKAKVNPATRLVDQKGGPKYKSVGWHEYLEIKDKHFQEALNFIKI